MSDPIQPEDDVQQDGFPARLRQAVAAYGSVTALAKAIARSEGAVRKWLRGVSEPNVSDLRAICALTGANIDWLVSGRGESQLYGKAVREMPGEYRTYTPSQMYHDLLENILETVDEELDAGRVDIAATKRSAMVVTLYSLFRESRQIDRAAVERLVRLAAS